MSRTDLLVSPSRQAAEHSAGQAKGCRFASNCNCVFAPAESAAAAPAITAVSAAAAAAATATAAPRDTVTEIEAEVAVLLQRGWKVTSADAHTVVLTRRRNMPFCVNVGLLLVTGFLWSIYMVARVRHPKIETTTLTY
ncbi:hypothetical protein B7R54_08380 [Subtercola boreus]|uniref:Uncharacterized protein n=1 Tax=Subtercola boreus TaxID=120213 RepID=A0A3E0VIM0_9MICO|nr:hypothetical protein [Subtercola boreus]RFA09240.1 hypothetical protein B7R54_08380 [Subtercola boreus]TQL53734.1 hypothetical protein FB464_1251 [Subtercola boreus]